MTTIRDAATVLVVRDAESSAARRGPSGPPTKEARARSMGLASSRDDRADVAAAANSSGVEVLMLLRTSTLDFSPGAHVFPGGAVDDADRAPSAAAACRGHSDASASAALGLPQGGLAYFIAAVRECFEEAGVLLGVDADVVPTLAAQREAIERGEIAFLDAVRAASATLSVDALVPFGHWITPPGGTRRYDTRFFLAVAPPDQVASPDGHEAVAAGWHRPADLLDAATAGEITLILPTQRSLEAIVDARTVADIVAGAAA